MQRVSEGERELAERGRERGREESGESKGWNGRWMECIGGILGN
jgi:hypothetical protein